jgi:PI-3-kinase-related kinase SMG-1
MCSTRWQMLQMALSAVRGPQLGRWLNETGGSNIQEDHLVFDLVKEFLQNAGQSQMIVQCEQSENELTQLALQQLILVRNCLDLLSQYSAICSLYPLSSMAQHRSVLYHDWTSKLLLNGTADTCHEVLAQLELHFAPLVASNPKVQRTVSFSYQVFGRLAYKHLSILKGNTQIHDITFQLFSQKKIPLVFNELRIFCHCNSFAYLQKS